MTQVRVLHVLTRAHRRGAETFGLVLHRELLTRVESSTVVALAAPSGDQEPLDVPVLGPAPRHPQSLLRLRRHADQADVVVAHGSSTLLACRMALLASRTPFVYVNIGDPLYWAAARSRRERVRWMLRGAAGVGAISPTARDRLIGHLGVPATRVAFTGNGRRSEDFPPPTPAQRTTSRQALGLDPSAPIAVVVAALSREKRVDTAIEAIAQLPAWQLLVVGGGALDSRLRNLADRLARGRVRFAGVLDDVCPAYWAADVALLTSETEGLPGVLIESAMTGLPSVATDVGFIADVVRDRQAGRLVPVGDALRTAHALEESLDHAVAWGQQARSHALDLFELDRVLDRWLELLTRVHTSAHRG